ncbi:MAG TPA: hypothetical protein VNN07_02365 [Candidatus Tectomicrobia bacterium]|nr:hypothetical protein [Candidatus Tectomicrobia bacterium]
MESEYKGIRIEIETHPAPGGWRVTAIIHTTLGSFVPARLASEAEVFETRQAAIDYALARARAAIDLVAPHTPPEESPP